MSGKIDVEGGRRKLLHPHLGFVQTDASLRRSMVDFPPVVWLTRNISVPNVLRLAACYTEDKKTGELRRMEISVDVADGIVLNRVALGFMRECTSAIPWAEYYGYNTAEGRELNETARRAGDEPDDWFVSERPIDLMGVSEFWSSRTILNPKLVRNDSYIEDIKRMVTLCRTNPKAFIPPTWMKKEQATEVALRLGVSLRSLQEG